MKIGKRRLAVRFALALFLAAAAVGWWIYRETIRSYVFRPQNLADWSGSITRVPPPYNPSEPPSRPWLDPLREAPPSTSYQTYAASTLRGAHTYYLLYLPPGYDDAANAPRRYPVVYWLHGHHAQPKYGMPFVEGLDAAIRAGACPPMIAVLPDGLDNSWYVDSEDGSQPVESVIIRDLIPHIDGSWRTIAEKRGRAIEGFSMGGWGAAHLAFKYPNLFCGVTLLSAPLHTHVSFPQFRRIFDRNAAAFYAEEPVLRARRDAQRLRDEGLRVRIIVGDRDRNASFVPLFDRQLSEWGIRHEVKILPGVGHDDDAVYRMLGNEGFRFYQELFTAGSM
jgi:endo-1,4-beta-xylanase